MDDLRFLNCDAYEYSGDGRVASSISSTKQLKRFGFEMNNMCAVSFIESFEAIEQALKAHSANLEKL